MRYCWLVTAISLLSACMCAGENRPNPRVVSIVQLIATPERFDGKSVSVVGFLSLEYPEGYLLYLHKQDYDEGLLENSLWIDATEAMAKNRTELHLKYVKIVGTFRAGHEKRNLFSAGGITEIKACQFWSDPVHPFRERIKNMQGKEHQ